MRYNPNGRPSKVSQAARELVALLRVKRDRLHILIEKAYKQYQELPLGPKEDAAFLRLQEALDAEGR